MINTYMFKCTQNTLEMIFIYLAYIYIRKNKLNKTNNRTTGPQETHQAIQKQEREEAMTP